VNSSIVNWKSILLGSEIIYLFPTARRQAYETNRIFKISANFLPKVILPLDSGNL
jgi:hypothetical protein